MSGIAWTPLFQSYTAIGVGQSFSSEPSVTNIFSNAKMNLFLSTKACLYKSICFSRRGSVMDLLAWETGSQGTCLDKAIDLEINRSKTVLSGRRRAKRYMMRKNIGRENPSWERERWESQAENSCKTAHRTGIWTQGRQPREPGILKPTGGRRCVRCCSKQSKKPKLKDIEGSELPGNLQGWRGATAFSHHALMKQMPSRTKNRRKGKKTGTYSLISLNKSNWRAAQERWSTVLHVMTWLENQHSCTIL